MGVWEVLRWVWYFGMAVHGEVNVCVLLASGVVVVWDGS